MKRIGSKLFTYVAVALILASVFTATALAVGDCTQDQLRDRDQLKDGSCQIDETVVMTGDMDKIQDQKRLKDGSCQIDETVIITGDMDKIQDQKRLKDGSCL